jgi:diaminopimelate epimerase
MSPLRVLPVEPGEVIEAVAPLWILQMSKHHGLGNDFLFLNDVDGFVGPTIEEGAALARQVCARHTGIGADGLLIALAAPEDGSADVTMRLHNADGSLAEMSGNGIRCFAQGLVDGMSEFEPGEIRVMTDAGLRVVVIDFGDGADSTAHVEVDMGVAQVGSHPLLGDVSSLDALTVDVGNPHVVIRRSDVDGAIGVVGPRLEAPYLDGPTHGINVELVASASPDAIDMVVWERGVGVTQACGTGAVASAVVAREWGMAGDRVIVNQPGGSSTVVLGPARDDRSVGVKLIGPTVKIADVEVVWRRG